MKPKIEVHLTPRDLSARLGLAPQKNGRGGGIQTLANWRSKGEGPKFFKIGKKVRYPLAEVEKWEAARLQRSTAG